MKVIFTLICLFDYMLALNENCVSSLECIDSACCRNNKCVQNDVCKSEMNNVYIAIGCVGIFFLIVNIIYFIRSIRITRENVRKMKEALNNDE